MRGGRLLIIPLYLTRYDLGVWRRFVHFGTISDSPLPRAGENVPSDGYYCQPDGENVQSSHDFPKPARLSDALMAVMRELFLGIGIRSEKTNTG